MSPEPNPRPLLDPSEPRRLKIGPRSTLSGLIRFEAPSAPEDGEACPKPGLYDSSSDTLPMGQHPLDKVFPIVELLWDRSITGADQQARWQTWGLGRTVPGTRLQLSLLDKLQEEIRDKATSSPHALYTVVGHGYAEVLRSLRTTLSSIEDYPTANASSTAEGAAEATSVTESGQ